MPLHPNNTDQLEQVTREMIEDKRRWPCPDRLPMKRRTDEFLLGYITIGNAIDARNGGQIVINLSNGAGVVTFPSVTDMLRAGWVVD